VVAVRVGVQWAQHEQGTGKEKLGVGKGKKWEEPRWGEPTVNQIRNGFPIENQTQGNTPVKIRQTVKGKKVVNRSPPGGENEIKLQVKRGPKVGWGEKEEQTEPERKVQKKTGK